jgi:hypothetical protein
VIVAADGGPETQDPIPRSSLPWRRTAGLAKPSETPEKVPWSLL